MFSEYSVTYSYKTPEDIEALTKDFMPFFEGLIIDSYYQYAIKQLSPAFFEAIGKPEFKNTTSMPDKWRKIHKEVVSLIHDGELKLQEIDENFGIKLERQAYEVSYTQALFFLMTYYDNFLRENEEVQLSIPRKYGKFVRKIIQE